MKKFTFVVALTGVCVGAAMAQAPRSVEIPALTNVKMVKVENTSTWKNKVSVEKPITRFDFVKENQKPIMRKPAQTSALPVPVALPASEVTDAYFKANWEPVSGVDGYMPEVYRHFKTSVDVGYCALYEDFPGTQASDQTVSGYIDRYTYRRDWALNGGKLGDQSVIFPKDAEAAALYTPFVDLSHGDGTGALYLGLNMSGTVGDSIAVVFGCYNYDTQKTETLGGAQLTVVQEGLYYYGFEGVPLDKSDSFIFSIVTFSDFGNKSDITLKKVVVVLPVKAGSDFKVLHDYHTVSSNATSAYFYTAEKDPETEGVSDTFSYGVYSFIVTADGSYIEDQSDMSNEIIVGESSAVEGIQASNDKIFVHDNLHVVLEKPATITVYNMAGVLVMSVEGVEGENEIALPAAGAYIVKAGNTVAKVMK